MNLKINIGKERRRAYRSIRKFLGGTKYRRDLMEVSWVLNCLLVVCMLFLCSVCCLCVCLFGLLMTSDKVRHVGVEGWSGI